MGDDKEKGFRVTDRRVSRSEDEAASEEKAAPQEEATPEQKPPSESAPAIDFNTFILSLSTSALMHLGELPEMKEAGKNLALAKQSIDCLVLLEEKTKGNLTGEEERLLSEILYDLRMRFVAATKNQS